MKIPQNKRVLALVTDRVVSGRYPVGSRMPSSRELASELGTNPTAVNQAYNELVQLGILSAIWGKGTFVASRPDVLDRTELVRIESTLVQAFTEAQRLGLSARQISDLGQRSIDAALGPVAAQVAVIECNESDIATCSRALGRRLGVRTTGVLVSEALAGGEAALEEFDVIAVTYFHLQEIKALVPGLADRIVGMNYAPSADSVRRLIELGAGAKVVTASGGGRGAESYRGLASMYGFDVVGSWSPERPQSELVAYVEAGAHIVSSVAVAGSIQAMDLPLAPVVVRYDLDDSAIAEVGRAVDRRRPDRVVTA